MQYNKLHQPDLAQVRRVAHQNQIGEVNPSMSPAWPGEAMCLKIETPYNRSTALFGALQKAFPDAELKNVGESHIAAERGNESAQNHLQKPSLTRFHARSLA